MKVSIVVPTGRPEPHIDWIADGLSAQAEVYDEIEIIVVDALARDRGPVVPCGVGSIRFALRTVPVKPCAWQGPHRVTSCDWWSLSAARNTGLVYASHDYVVFMDDRCRLGPEWLATVRKGYLARTSVLAGAYDKREDDPNRAPSDNDSNFIPREWTTIDHRFKACPSGRLNCGGGWLFGCCVALPLAWALEINGFEEGCDGLGMEDVIFGMNLERAGHRIDFAPKMFVHQDRTVAGRGPVYRKTDKGVSPNDKSHAALDRFRKRARTDPAFTPDLLELRRARERGDDPIPWPMPDPDLRDWYDGQLVREMIPPM